MIALTNGRVAWHMIGRVADWYKRGIYVYGHGWDVTDNVSPHTCKQGKFGEWRYDKTKPSTND